MRRLVLAAALAVAACGTAFAQAPAAPATRPPPFVITSSAFEDGGVIPDKYSQKTPNAPSIPLSWTNAPAGTQSFVLYFHDVDVAANRTMTDSLHWLAWNIPATATALPEGVPNVATLPDGTVQLTHRNTMGYVGPGYGGPNYHHYIVELIALDTKLDLPSTTTREAVLQAVNGRILGKAITTGRFHR